MQLVCWTQQTPQCMLFTELVLFLAVCFVLWKVAATGAERISCNYKINCAWGQTGIRQVRQRARGRRYTGNRQSVKTGEAGERVTRGSTPGQLSQNAEQELQNADGKFSETNCARTFATKGKTERVHYRVTRKHKLKGIVGSERVKDTGSVGDSYDGPQRL